MISPRRQIRRLFYDAVETAAAPPRAIWLNLSAIVVSCARLKQQRQCSCIRFCCSCC